MRFKRSLLSDTDGLLIAKTIRDDRNKEQIKTARWYAERKGANEFSTKQAIAFEGAVVELSLEEKERMLKERMDEFFEVTAEQYKAFAERSIDEEYLKEAQHSLAKAKARLESLTPKAEAQAERIEEANRISNIENGWLNKKEDYEKWLKEFKAECLKDGIKVEEVNNRWMNGTTPNGKRFLMEINNGYTLRSFHCYTLKIDRETIFTSGDFSTCYYQLKNN